MSFKARPCECCSVLQCVAVCGSVWQCVAVGHKVFQCVVVWYVARIVTIPKPAISFEARPCECCSVLQCVAVCGSVWQCVAVCGSVCQWVTMCCNMVCCEDLHNSKTGDVFEGVTLRVLQRVAACCSVLQCVAVCGSVL